MTDPLRHRASVIESLGSSLRRGGASLGTVPGLLKRVIREEAWREFETSLGDVVRHERFADFVATPPLKGLGASVPLLKRICADDPEALDLIDRAMGRKGRADKITANVDNIHDSGDLERPSGTSRDSALRKLRKDAPELHAEVLAGRLSAHAAMVKAGFRPKTFTVRPDPESAARTLRKHMSPDDLRALARLLLEEEDA